MPLEVQALSEAAGPSWHHVKKICNILKFEYWKQVCFFLDWLRVLIQEGTEGHRDTREFAEYRKLASQTPKFLKFLQKTMDTVRVMKNVTVFGGDGVPAAVKDALEEYPKLSF